MLLWCIVVSSHPLTNDHHVVKKRELSDTATNNNANAGETFKSRWGYDIDAGYGGGGGYLRYDRFPRYGPLASPEIYVRPSRFGGVIFGDDRFDDDLRERRSNYIM